MLRWMVIGAAAALAAGGPAQAQPGSPRPTMEVPPAPSAGACAQAATLAEQIKSLSAQIQQAGQTPGGKPQTEALMAQLNALTPQYSTAKQSCAAAGA